MDKLIKLTEPSNEDLTRHYFVKLVGGGIGAFNGKGMIVYTIFSPVPSNNNNNNNNNRIIRVRYNWQM